MISSEKQSLAEYDSIASNSYSSVELKQSKKGRKKITIEKLGESEEYDQSLIKRRK